MYHTSKKEKIDPIYDLNTNGQHYSMLLPGEEIRLVYPIEGLIDIVPNSYFVSSYGRVYSWIKNKGFKLYEIPINHSVDGYPYVSLQGINRKELSFRLNRLVAFFFIPMQININYNQMEVDHIDCNIENNSWINLRWLTPDLNKNYKGMHQALIAEGNEEEWDRRVKYWKSIQVMKSIEEYYYWMQFSNIYIEKEIKLAKEIFIDYQLNNTSINELHRKYGENKEKIGRIIKLTHPFNLFLHEEDKSTPSNHHEAKDDMIAKSIYIDIACDNTYEYILKKYGVYDGTAKKIAILSGPYGYMKYRYNMKPLTSIYLLSDKEIIDIYVDIKNGLSPIDIILKHGIFYYEIEILDKCIYPFDFLSEIKIKGIKNNKVNILQSEEIILPMKSIPNIISIKNNSYFISSKGRIFYINRLGKMAEAKLTLRNDGYLMVRISDENNNRFNYRINKLVAYYFLPLIHNARDLEVFNADGNKLNNDWRNLRWCTHRTGFILAAALTNKIPIR